MFVHRIKNLLDLNRHLHHHVRDPFDISLSSRFHCYDTLKSWVEDKLKKFPFLEEIKLGKTYEKRDIFVLKLSTGKKNKAIFLMGGEEGRDWTSPAILLYFLNYLLEKKLEILTKHYDFYILPMFNPDGYMYSMMKDRIWSKNSRVYFPKVPCSENASAIGIKVDRNWFFNKSSARNEECDPIYMGLKPLSEEETLAVSQFLNKIALQMMAFINVRGFLNLITIPYAFKKKYCNNYAVLMDMLSAVHASVVKQHNTTFNYGLASKYIYNFSGNAADWVKKELNTPIVYTIYLENGNYVLPSASDIKLLATRLSTMIKEISLLANTFYGPLFNIQFRNSINIFILITNILLII